MVFVPRQPIAAALPGLAPPRAVPSDLVIAIASRVVPADIAQKLVLLAIFVLGCAGVAALLDTEPLLARLAGGIFYAWNPYVAERLIIGQWALLLGYAGLPWVLRAVLNPDEAPWRWTGRLCLSLVPAVIGGFAAMAITALVVVPAALLTRNTRRAAIALAALVTGSLPWLIPALQHTVYIDPGGVAAFAARADTPFGSVGSLLMLGGIWNAQTVPKGYGGAWSALWLAAGARRPGRVPGRRPARPPLARAWGGRDRRAADRLHRRDRARTGSAQVGDQRMAGGRRAARRPAVRGAARAGRCRRLRRGGSPGDEPRPVRDQRDAGTAGLDRPGVALAVLALVAPVLLLPGLAWGAAGRLRPAWYPAGWLAAARMIDASPARGDVLLLPWETYRRPAWNHGEAVFDPWSKLLSRPVIWNDGTRVGDVGLAPDDPRARRLDGAIRGSGPLTEVLGAAGVRFVVDDADGPSPGPRLPGAVVLVDQPGLTVYRLPG